MLFQPVYSEQQTEVTVQMDTVKTYRNKTLNLNCNSKEVLLLNALHFVCATT